jgi:hypothetical protein
MGARVKSGSASMIEFVSSQSPHKRPDPSTEAGKAQIQATADDLADVFVDAVAANRGVSRDAVLSDFGRGGSLVGSKAVAAGMADRVGSLEQVIAELARGETPGRTVPKPAPRAATQPRRAAMSEPNTNEPTVSASEHADLLRRLKDAEERAEAEARAKAEALQAKSEAIEETISARASGFVVEMKDTARRIIPGQADAVNRLMAQAIRDDFDHPLAAGRTARQDAVRAAFESGKQHKFDEERIPAGATTLPNDPVAARGSAEDDAARERRRQENQAWAKQRNAAVEVK